MSVCAYCGGESRVPIVYWEQRRGGRYSAITVRIEPLAGRESVTRGGPLPPPNTRARAEEILRRWHAANLEWDMWIDWDDPSTYV